MSSAIVFGFAVAPGHQPVPGTAPLPVLARQLPRSLVLALNGDADLGVRFFPFLGRDGEQRRYLELDDVLPLEALQQFAQSAAGPDGELVDLLVDGVLGAEDLRLRIHRAGDGRCILDESFPFDRRDPAPAITRALFEITGALGRSGGLPPSDPLTGPALAWYLVARDDLLSWEAGVAVEGPPEHRLRAIREVVRLAPDEVEVQRLAASLAAHAHKQPELVPAAAELLAPLIEHASPGPAGSELVSVAAALHDKAGDRRAAATLHCLAAELDPRPQGRVESVRQAAALWFLLEDFAAAGQRLDEELGRGTAAWDPATADAGMLTQRLAVADRQGDRELCRELCAALARRARGGERLSPQVLRMVTAQLAATDRPGDAVAVAEQGLGGRGGSGPVPVHQAGDQHALRLEYGRALLLAGRTADGLAQLDRIAMAEDQQVPLTMRREAGRLGRLAAAEGLLEGAQSVEHDLHHGRLDAAHRTARGLVRRHPNHGEAWFLLGVVEQRRDRAKRALKAFRRALDEEADLPEAANRLGILLVAQGQPEVGRTWLEQAAAGLPGESAPRLHLAQACAASGDREAGERHLAAAESLGADPDHVASIRAAFFAA